MSPPCHCREASLPAAGSESRTQGVKAMASVREKRKEYKIQQPPFCLPSSPIYLLYRHSTKSSPYSASCLLSRSVKATPSRLLDEVLVRCERCLPLCLFLADLGHNHFAEHGAVLHLIFKAGLLVPRSTAATASRGAREARDGSLCIAHIGAVRVGLFDLELGDALLQLDGQDGVLELFAGLLGAAQLGQQIVIGGILAA